MATSDDGDAFTPRRLLVTGAAGFIGFHVLQHVMRTGPLSDARALELVVGLDRVDYCSVVPSQAEFAPRRNGARPPPRYVFERVDTCDYDEVVRVLAEHDIDAVIHLAALTHVDNSFGDDLQFTQANVVGTHVLLEAVRSRAPRVKRFLHVSTDEVYGENRSERAFVETDALEPRNPYAATKAAAEAIAKSYLYSFHVPIVVARPNNVYGPRQFPEKVVPKFCRQLQLGTPLTIHGDGAARRCFLFVTDCAAALVEFCLRRGVVGEVYNVGGTDTFTVAALANELARAFAEHVSPPPPPPQSSSPGGGASANGVKVVHVEDRLFNDRSYDISSAKLKALGWPGPTTPWSVGVKTTVAWYVSHPMFWTNEDLALVPHPRLVSNTVPGGSPRSSAAAARSPHSHSQSNGDVSPMFFHGHGHSHGGGGGGHGHSHGGGRRSMEEFG